VALENYIQVHHVTGKLKKCDFIYMQSNSLEQPRQAGVRGSKVTPLSKITSSHKGMFKVTFPVSFSMGLRWQ